jgi:excisionase family DNA binding protein
LAPAQPSIQSAPSQKKPSQDMITSTPPASVEAGGCVSGLVPAGVVVKLAMCDSCCCFAARGAGTSAGVPEDTVDLKSLSFLANRSERSLYRDMATGRLKALRVGRQVKFSREEVARYLGGEWTEEAAGVELAAA